LKGEGGRVSEFKTLPGLAKPRSKERGFFYFFSLKSFPYNFFKAHDSHAPFATDGGPNQENFMKRLTLCVIALATLAAGPGCGGFVNNTFNVPRDFFFIQDALNFSVPGDTVTVNCGTYSSTNTGEIFPLFVPGGVSLKGASANCVILDAQSFGPVIVVNNYDSGIISGLTLVNGLANNGGGMSLSNVSNLFVEGNIFQGNQASNLGSGLSLINGGPGMVIQNNLFVGNTRSSVSAGVPAAVQLSNSQAQVFNNVIANGDGDGLSLNNGTVAQVENNIFYKNGSGTLGFGLFDSTPSTSTLVAFNLFFGNVENDISVGGNSVTAAQANALSGTDQFSNNISGDPLFVNPINPLIGGDFHLSAGSPGIGAGDPNPQFNNLNGTRNDMGVFGGPFPLF